MVSSKEVKNNIDLIYACTFVLSFNARSSMYFVCFSLTRSTILSTWQTVPSSRVEVLVSLSCTITQAS